MAATSSQPPMELSNDDEKPLWRYVAREVRKERGNSNITWKCSFCNETKTSTYTRVRAHLLKIKGQQIAPCKGVKAQDIAEMKKLEEEAAKRLDDRAARVVPLPTASSSMILEGNMADSRKRRYTTSSSGSTSQIEKAFNLSNRKHLHAEIARMFYCAGLPFNLAKNPYYVSSYKFAANNKLAGYMPPHYNMLRTGLLQQERKNVERQLLPIKSTWPEKGVSLVTDGWSDSQRRSLINFMAVNESGPMFLEAVDCSGEIKDKEFIFGLMRKMIEKIGPKNVIQVITDNAANCKGAGELVEAAYPHIVWTPCVVHTLNLALQNICNPKVTHDAYQECSWISSIAEDATIIKNFILNHSKRLDIFKQFSRLNLLQVATTRFASVIVMLKRFVTIKENLGQMVFSPQWNAIRDVDMRKAHFVKQKVTDDDWWDDIVYILAFTEPIYEMLRFTDTDASCLHLVYDMWDTMIEKVKQVIHTKNSLQVPDPNKFYEVVHAILISRWNKNNTPLHCLAHSLNPRYYSQEWLQQSSDLPRQAPHKDGEVSNGRVTCLAKYFSNENELLKVTMEYANFSTMSGDFSRAESIAHRFKMPAKSWWVTYGANSPLLQNIALKLLVQPSSSSSAERNWSTYSFINSIRRNKLLPPRAEDLVFVHSNIRLLERAKPTYLEGISKMWDIGGDEFGTLDDVGELGIASLSLDEPELEAILFNDVVEEVLEDDENVDIDEEV